MDSKWQGQGTLIFPDGAKYQGDWFDDNMNGQGTFTWANGDMYVENLWIAKDMDRALKLTPMDQ